MASMNAGASAMLSDREGELMRMHAVIHVGVLLLSWLVPTSVARGQTQASDHTLRLERKENIPRARIEAIAWLAGRWVGGDPGESTEEIWSPPVGNSMMGIFRLVKNGKVIFYEFCTITEENESLVLKIKHFDSRLNGWEEKNVAVIFPLVKLAATDAYFDGLTYHKNKDGSLTAYVLEHSQGTGKTHEEAFSYQRAKTDTTR
jgi:hypothetical protein